MKSDPLAGLRDYHLPEPLSWWPPAPGWWLLALLAVAVAVALVWRHWQRQAPVDRSRLAALELDRLRARWRADADTMAFMRDLSQLARRFVLARFPGEPVAGLCGEQWLRYLARKSAESGFVDGAGRRLADAPYCADQGVADGTDVAAVADLVQRLIERNGELAATQQAAPDANVVPGARA